MADCLWRAWSTKKHCRWPFYACSRRSARFTFGPWLQRRRQALHLTQQQLGLLAGCSLDTIRKLEAESRRPSADVARMLATALHIPTTERAAFLRFARGEREEHPPILALVEPTRLRPIQPPSNLAIPPTPLIGREAEVTALRDLFLHGGARLVTLTGPGGVGKTRLGVAVPTSLRDVFVDGATFVDLAPVSEPERVLSIIAQLLNVQEVTGQPLLTSVQSHVRDRQMLLILDNFEQILAAGLMVAELLGVAPHLRLLITSRIPLHVRGEHEVAVEPLALPDRDVHDVEALSQYDAVRLFIERAQAVNAGFKMTNTTAPAVAEICKRLDGLPLAIELAAARIKLLSPDALLHRLTRMVPGRLTMLTGGARDLPLRQQTIRATIDWSYALLEPSEQRLFAQLAVFSGGWTLDAAEVICEVGSGPELSMLDGLQSLLDKSLLRHDEAMAAEPRLTMLETIREYALTCFEASGAAEDTRRRHATYYLALVMRATSDNHLERLDAEQDNLRTALDWTIRQTDAPMAVGLVSALMSYWWTRGHWREGRGWAEAVLPLGNRLGATERLGVWECVGMMAAPLGDRMLATRAFEEALTYARAADTQDKVAFHLLNLGGQATAAGDFKRAHALQSESLTIYRQLGDAVGVALVLQDLGATCADFGDDTAALGYLEESLSLARAN